MIKKVPSFFILLLVTLLACSTNQSIETKVKKYMKDSIVSTFNDPSSYEFVSMNIDTFKLKDYISNIRKIYRDTTVFSKTEQQNHLSEAAELEKRNVDSIINFQITVKCRGKNAMGVLILNDINLIYDPQTNKITKSQLTN